jgi:glyoxylase-like metal-dependent hydrolase (beta-lactamase superfamily II)
VSFVPVADDVLVRTSRRMSTTTTLFLQGGAGVLVDPSWLPDELDAIADELAQREVRVTTGFSTHPHHDHLLWHPRLGAAPRWASPRAAATANEHRDELLQLLDAGYPAEVLTLFAAVQPLPGNSLPDPFGTDGAREVFEVVAHDGHAPGHAALWSPERGVLVVGDMLSDVEVPLPFWPDDLGAYLAGLDALAPYVSQASVLVPGHGTPSSAPLERLDADRRYLDDVMAGRTPDDARLADPQMRQEYDHLVRMVRQG